jgi:hypothetical protein
MNRQPPDTSSNTSFSRELPGLQLAVDSTSLGEYKTCPMKYYYTVVLGYQPRLESVHLTFGILLHQARERYDHLRVRGQDHESTVRDVTSWVLTNTWDKRLGRAWISDHKQKNRHTLLRTVIWYLDELAEHDPLETVILASGKPAVELSFSFDSGFKAEATGETIMLCGHLDRLATMNGVSYVVDLKTTGHTLDASYFAGYSPDNQFSLYMLAGRVAFGVPVKAMIVDAAQIAVGFSRFARGLVARDDAQISEWHTDTGQWLSRMEQSAVTNHWPMNDKSCNKFGGCTFRKICSKSPEVRQKFLESDFERRVWNPLEPR